MAAVYTVQMDLYQLKLDEAALHKPVDTQFNLKDN